MSHDAWLEIDTGGPELAYLTAIGNYTRNVSPMWHKAMTVAAGKDMWIDDTEGMTGAEASQLFLLAAKHMVNNPDDYTPMNPENGWGNYKGALKFLEQCAEQCARNPKAIIRWSV